MTARRVVIDTDPGIDGGTDEAAWQGRPLLDVCVGVDAAGVVDLVSRRPG